METSYLKTLELDKIIARAAEGCVCKEAREMLLATQPQCDPDEVRYALEQTDAINTLLRSTTLCLQTICSMRWHRSRAWNSRSPAPFWHRMPWQTRPLIP